MVFLHAFVSSKIILFVFTFIISVEIILITDRLIIEVLNQVVLMFYTIFIVSIKEKEITHGGNISILLIILH